MRIWAVAIVLALLVPVVAVTTAAASPGPGDHHNKGTGTISFSQGAIVSGPKVLNDHTTIEKVMMTLSFTGNMSGSANTIERDVVHTHTHDGTTITFTTFHGWGNFTGRLGSVQVTLHIRYEGVKNSTFTRGNFVVKGDTGQMNDVHGEGHFRGAGGTPEGGSGGGVNYTMHWHVSTHTEQPKAKDKD
ncbi:MAG TPA: hypothetical protein VE955_11100 [Candidatus Dormibacteraeota bacterium]|nr:hypothetical protein [Candidatus Dormibacteraeota bacterium]